MFGDVPRLGGHQAHHQAQFVRPVDHVVHVLEELLVGPGRVAVDERRRVEERRVAVRVFLAQSAQHIRLDDREALGGAVFQILVHFLAIEPLKEQPARVAEVEERLAVLIDEVSPVRADPEFEVLDGVAGCMVQCCGGNMTVYRRQRKRAEDQKTGGEQWGCNDFHWRFMVAELESSLHSDQPGNDAGAW